MSEAKNLEIADSDRRLLAKLEGFIPEKIFDIHAHLFETACLPSLAVEGSLFYQCGPAADRGFFERSQGCLYPGLKKLRLNVVSAPDGAMADKSNGLRDRSLVFLAKHLEAHPEDVGEAFVLPDDTEDDIKGLLVHPNIRGFKCYHSTAAKKPTWYARIDEYLPESAWRVADERGLCITLHMVRDAALADPLNNEAIREKARKYPSAKLILAHCARGFASWTVTEGIRNLTGLSNIYYDVSAVCEPASICAVLKAAEKGRVLWGSDFPVSMSRGKSISVADGFSWLVPKDIVGHPVQEAAETCLVGVENLHALKLACEILDLGRRDVEDIFYNNAMRMFGLAD